MLEEVKIAARVGRQRSTSRAELSHIALQLFLDRGFDETTVDDIAAAAGIGRRTLFRYFSSKNDLPWGDFSAGLEHMRAYLAALPVELGLIDALCAAVIDFNRFPIEEVPYHRERMRLLLNVPSLIAHSSLRYVAWREVVAEFTATKMGVGPDSLLPHTIGWTFLGASLAAYEVWLQNDDAELIPLLESSLAMLRDVFGRGDSDQQA